MRVLRTIYNVLKIPFAMIGMLVVLAAFSIVIGVMITASTIYFCSLVEELKKDPYIDVAAFRYMNFGRVIESEYESLVVKLRKVTNE